MTPTFRLAFLDIDETLTTAASEPKENIGRLLSMLGTHGIRHAFATGRGMYFIEYLLRRDRSLLDGYFIAHDGALVMNPVNREILHASRLAPATVKMLLLQSYAAKLSFNGQNAIYSSVNAFEETSSLYRFWREFKLGIDFYQMYARGLTTTERADLERLCADVGLTAYSFPYRQDPTQFSLLAINKDNDKGRAIRIVAKRLGVDLSEVLIVGDGINDISAFKVGAFNVATTEAVSELKDLASSILESGETIYDFLHRRLN